MIHRIASWLFGPREPDLATPRPLFGTSIEELEKAPTEYAKPFAVREPYLTVGDQRQALRNPITVMGQQQFAARHQNYPHPWIAYLAARADVIDWLHAEECNTDEEIAITLSMSVGTVTAIRTRARPS